MFFLFLWDFSDSPEAKFSFPFGLYWELDWDLAWGLSILFQIYWILNLDKGFLITKKLLWYHDVADSEKCHPCLYTKISEYNKNYLSLNNDWYELPIFWDSQKP